MTQTGVTAAWNIYRVIYVAFALAADVESIWTGELEQAMYVYFPYEYNFSVPFLIVETIYNHLTVIMAYAALCACDDFFVLVFLNILMTSAIIRRELKDLDSLLENPHTEPRDVRNKLKNYLTMHLKYNE